MAQAVLVVTGDRWKRTYMWRLTHTSVLLHRHTNRVESIALQTRGVTGEPWTHTGTGRARLTQETAETRRSCLFPCSMKLADSQRERAAHRRSRYVQPIFSLYTLPDKVLVKTTLSVWESSGGFGLPWYCITAGQLDIVLRLLFEKTHAAVRKTPGNLRESCTCIHPRCDNWGFWRLKWTQSNWFWPPRTSFSLKIMSLVVYPLLNLPSRLQMAFQLPN